MKISGGNERDYSNTIKVNSTAKATFNAVNKELSNWWGTMDKPVQGKGDVFTVSWGEPWYQFKVFEYVPDKKISWECIDSKQIIAHLDGVEKEWVGTKIHWSIRSVNPKQVEVSFVHEGLIPDFICYDFCSSTWDHFIADRLKKYLEA